jgi:hypothetical protein
MRVIAVPGDLALIGRCRFRSWVCPCRQWMKKILSDVLTHDSIQTWDANL